MLLLNPFTPESDQYQNSPAASQEIWHHIVWRTWLFIAYSDEKWLYYKFSLHHSYNRFLKGWENTLFELRSERVKRLVECACLNMFLVLLSGPTNSGQRTTWFLNMETWRFVLRHVLKATPGSQRDSKASWEETPLHISCRITRHWMAISSRRFLRPWRGISAFPLAYGELICRNYNVTVHTQYPQSGNSWLGHRQPKLTAQCSWPWV